MIEFQDVRRTYHKGTEEIRALDGVSLMIRQGEFVAITGPSGSGKSTLMNIMGLLDRADSGSYRLDGRDVAQLSADAQASVRNERIGFVFQMFHLLPRTSAVENVELPLVYSDHRVPRDIGMRALERVGLADRARHFPNELSGGQQQRVAIARALVLEPDIILADEPTGNLDSTSSNEILEILRALNEAGTTIVVITHDAAVSRFADRVIPIADGRIAMDTPAAAPIAGGGAAS
jgi:ABC-type lipoprotein export system ATPase subunit